MKKISLTGAGSGIGKAMAAALTEQGRHEVWGTSRDNPRLPNFARFHRVQLDLSDSDVGTGPLAKLQGHICGVP